MEDKTLKAKETSESEDYYIFDLDKEVKRTHVYYKNRYGIDISADLYRSKDLILSRKYPAIVIGPPHGGVKEQGPGIYAQELAKRGFIVVAFDPSYNGKSSGEPRHVTSPEIFAEDFSAGVDFLGTLPYVDRNKIGILGICGSGGFALSQASVDKRIKAIATSAMYDISGVSRKGWYYKGNNEDRNKELTSLSEQRWRDVDSGTPELQSKFPLGEYDASKLDDITAEFFEFYAKVNHRGWHPRSIGAFTLTSFASHINFGELKNLNDIYPRKVLIITGDIAHSKWFSDNVHAQMPDNSEEIVVNGARHIDLYDRTDLIPFDKLATFFKENLR